MNSDVLINEQTIGTNRASAGAIATDTSNQLGQSDAVNLMFVDSAVDDIDSLISQVAQNTQVILLDSKSDGISQITDALSQFENVASLNVVSHGQAGQLQLGSSTISSSDLADYSSQLQSWQGSLTENADILFYGCNVAAGDKGSQFLSQFGELTGADIAASTDLTGNTQLGGDWDLEYTSGDIETTSPFAQSIKQTYGSVLQGKVLYSNDGGSLNNVRVDSKTNHGVNSVNNPDGSGKVLKFDLRRTDQLSNNKHRAEVVPQVSGIDFGKDYTYSFRTYFPKDWKSDNSGEIVAQWHGRPDKNLGESYRNPPAALRVVGDSFDLRQAWDAKAVTNTRDKSSHGQRFTTIGDLKRGEWIDWKFEIKWSYKSDGVFKIYRNDKLVFDEKGPNTFNDKVAPYSKFGIYKPDWTVRPQKSSTTRRVFYGDDYTITSGHGTNSKPIGIQSLPTAKNDSFTIKEDTSLNGNVINGPGKDSAGAGSIKIVGNTKPSNGSLSIKENGDFTYTPKANFFGTDKFNYTIRNSSGGTDTATVTVKVQDVPEPQITPPEPITPKPTPESSSFRVEAESLQLNSYRLESKSFASGGKIIGLRGGKANETGSATYVHKGEAGNFDIDLRYFDENDGAANISIKLNGKQIDRWVLNAKTNGTNASNGTSRIRSLKGIELEAGDRLQIVGSETQKEHVRLDYLDFKAIAPKPVEPKLTPIRVEAEALQTKTYRTETNSFASGGKLLSLRGQKTNEVGQATYTHNGGNGTYSLNLNYFDENDGASTIKVLVNGKQVDRWTLNQKTNGTNISAATARTRSIDGLTLSKGDRITIVGSENAKEHARIDYLELIPELAKSLG